MTSHPSNPEAHAKMAETAEYTLTPAENKVTGFATGRITIPSMNSASMATEAEDFHRKVSSCRIEETKSITGLLTTTAIYTMTDGTKHCVLLSARRER